MMTDQQLLCYLLVYRFIMKKKLLVLLSIFFGVLGFFFFPTVYADLTSNLEALYLFEGDTTDDS
jgi:hypothetical protein